MMGEVIHFTSSPPFHRLLIEFRYSLAQSGKLRRMGQLRSHWLRPEVRSAKNNTHLIPLTLRRKSVMAIGVHFSGAYMLILYKIWATSFRTQLQPTESEQEFLKCAAALDALLLEPEIDEDRLMAEFRQLRSSQS
jgi:hypothetical protein